MSLFNRNPDNAAARADYKAAKQALHTNQNAEIQAGIDHETPEYLRLNHAANEAAAKLPWWQR